MSVKIRLKRMGAKKRPFYRIVVADSRFPRDGRFIEEVGYYNPIETPAVVKIDKDLAMKWLRNGAIPTDTVRDMFSKEGIMKEFHESKMTKKAPKAKKEIKEKKPAAKKTTTKKSTAAKKTETTKKTTTKKAGK